MSQQLLSYIQIGVAILLGTAILLQQKGQGLSGAFGGEGGFYRTKRGLEKTLLISTVVLAVLFMGLGVSRLLLVPPSPIEQQQLESEPTADASGAEPILVPDIEVVTEPTTPSSEPETQQ